VPNASRQTIAGGLSKVRPRKDAPMNTVYTFDRLSMREVSRKAGVSHQAPAQPA